MCSLCRLLSTRRIVAVSSSRSLITTGTSVIPAISHAFTRLCPESISYPPSLCGLATTGDKTPLCLMLSTSSSILSSSRTLNGCCSNGFKSVIAIGFISSVRLPSSVLKRSSYDFRPMLIFLPATILNLLCKASVCICCFAVTVICINAHTYA